jgi:hypothetical protein
VTGTIASARRNRHRFEDEEQTNGHVSSSDSRWRGALSCLFDIFSNYQNLCLEPSFISEESFVRAPLNSRIVSGTTSTKSKGKAKEESLDAFPLEVQEAMVLEDLLYVLMVCDLPIFHASTSVDVMCRVSKEPISHIMRITHRKMMMHSREYDSRSQNG